MRPLRQKSRADCAPIGKLSASVNKYVWLGPVVIWVSLTHGRVEDAVQSTLSDTIDPDTGEVIDPV